MDVDRLITIYDLAVVLNWSGTASDGTAVEGKLTIPEVSHEITLDGTSDFVVRLFFFRFSCLQSTHATGCGTV